MPLSSEPQNPGCQIASSHREPLAVIGIGCRLPGRSILRSPSGTHCSGGLTPSAMCRTIAGDIRGSTTPIAMGTAICSLSNRISYDFNLKGPSVSLDTACSASLTALHLACQSVWNGEAEMAIAGGVNVMLRPEPSIMLSKGGFLNPDQYCKAFDASANGSVLGIERTSEQRNLFIGSVKTNLGHLEGAAGIAGFIKGVLTAY